MSPTCRRALLALVAFAAPPALAQDAEPAFAVEAPETVVTAGRLPGDAARTGRNVTVITAADVERSTARSLGELLRFEAGVLVTPRAGFGAQADLSMRGGTFNGVVVLVDGARFNDPMTGHFLSDFPIPLAEVARVEVLRGPDAAAWGPDATGGVVHVITRTASGGARGRGGAAGGEASASAGGLGTATAAAALRLPVGRALVGGAADLARTDGEPVRDGAGRPVVGPVRTDFERVAGTAAVSVPLRSARLTARYAADDRDFGAYQFYTPFASDTAREATRTDWLQARVASDRAARTTWSVRLAGRRHTDRYTYYPGLDPNRHTTRRATLAAEVAHRPAPGLVLGGGVSAEGRNVTSNSLGEHGDVAGGAFALARWTPAPPVTLSASARVDADPGFGVEATPMLAVALAAAPGVSVRAAAGRAVRAPTYVERYFNTVAPRPGGNLGNPDLRAERAWNAEGGLDLAPVPGLSLQATAFWRRTGDLIDFVRTERGGEDVFLAQNVLEARAAGLETSASLARRLGGAALRLSAGYTYTDVSVDPGAFAAGDFKYVLDHAPHLAQVRAALDVGPLAASVEGLHKTRVSADAFTVVHLRAGARAGRAEVFAEVRNVFDARYAEVFGAPMPGRTVLGGLRVRFGEG